MTDPKTSRVATTSPEWPEIHARLSAPDPAALGTSELEALAEATFWLGRPHETIAALQRLYRRYRDADDLPRTTRTAWQLFQSHYDLDETAAASGWLNRARRHAEEVRDVVEAGYVALGEAQWSLYQGQLDDALGHARSATDSGRRHGDRDLEALGLATQGRIFIASADAPAGLARLDEAMVAAVSDELSAFATGWVYCVLLSTCQELGDVRRAAEWTELAIRWCEKQGRESWYPGLCQLHRCEVQSLQGHWIAAEQAALRAADELAPFGDYLIAESQYLAGEIRRLRGDYAGADEAFRRAHQHGHDVQPGSALLRLAQGDVDSAAAGLRLALAGGPATPLRRARILSAHVKVALRRGEVDAAIESTAELDRLGASTGARLIQALAAIAHGAVQIAGNDFSKVLPLLKDACAICMELSCPYEAAEARVLIGLAARGLGDDETARLELEAARSIFDRLGATPDVQNVTVLLQSSEASPGGLTAREVEVLRLIARGRSNRAIAAELYISEHTVARHVSNIFRKLGVASRSAATSFAYEHHLT